MSDWMGLSCSQWPLEQSDREERSVYVCVCVRVCVCVCMYVCVCVRVEGGLCEKLSLHRNDGEVLRKGYICDWSCYGNGTD